MKTLTTTTSIIVSCRCSFPSQDVSTDRCLDPSDDGSDELSLKSTHSFILPTQDDEETLRRTPSSLNSFSILPPIKPTTPVKLDGERQINVIKHLQEKYHATDGHHDRTGGWTRTKRVSFRMALRRSIQVRAIRRARQSWMMPT